jgi:hypothetical protein
MVRHGSPTLNTDANQSIGDTAYGSPPSRGRRLLIEVTLNLYRPAACGTVSISLPAKTGGKVGLPSGEPPAGSTVTA